MVAKKKSTKARTSKMQKLSSEKYKKLLAKERKRELDSYKKLLVGSKKKSKEEFIGDLKSQYARQKGIEEQLKGVYERSQKADTKKYVSRAIQYPIKRAFSGTKRSSGEQDFSSKVRKLINLASPKGSLAKSLTYSAGVSRGRGRPTKTYKARYVPGVGYVRVPTAQYNKMISEYKTRQRLLQAQKMAQAEQVALQQDPRYQQEVSDEDFLGVEDIPDYPQQMPQIQEEVPIQSTQYRQQPNIIQRFVQGANNLVQPRRNPFFNTPQQQQFNQYGMPIQRPQVQGAIVREPRVTVVSDRSNLLSIPNQFDRPENAKILFKRREVYY
jgi:hypothetical protein